MKGNKKYVLDPRQTKAIAFYKDPTSETFCNLYQSLMRAGYTKSSANSLVSKKNKWLADNIESDVDLIRTSENNLREFTKIQADLDTKIGLDANRLKADVSKFVLERLAKGKYGKDKEDTMPEVVINIVEPKKPDKIITVDTNKSAQ